MKTKLWVVLAILALRANAQNIVSNNSFEAYGATLTGWNSVEGYGWVGVTTSAADGQTYATITGDLYQDLATTPGRTYLLRYAVAGSASSGIATLQTRWGGTLVATITFDTTGHSNENLGWVYVTNIVLASSSTTRLWFANGNFPTSPFPNVDDVGAFPVDAPPTSCDNAPNDLTGWWKAEGDTIDSASNNYGNLLNGAGFTNGLVGQAFYFAGDNQCLIIPYAPALISSNYSIETWVQPLSQISDSSTQAVIFAQYKGRCQLWALPGTSGLRLALQFAVDPSSSVGLVSTAEIPIGQFSHVAGTWDGTNLSLYVNGTLDSQITPGAVPFDSGCHFFVGGIYSTLPASCVYSGGFFNGIVDEVSYYRRALSAGEISSIFQAGNFGKCSAVHPPSITLQPVSKTVYAGSTVTFTANATGDGPLGFQWRFNGTNLSNQTTASLTLANVQIARSGSYSLAVNNPAGSALSSNALLTVLPAPPCVNVTNGLVSWWRAETNLFDSWDSNDGTLLFGSSGAFGSPYLGVAYAPGKVGQAFNISSNGVLVIDNVSLRMTKELSIECWVNPTTVSGSIWRTILSKSDSPTGFGSANSYYLGASNGFVVLKVSPNGANMVSLSSPQPLPTGLWTHVAATYDSAALRLYLNGALVAETNYSSGIFAGTSDVGIGAVPLQRASWYLPWSGYLDEISLYNRALSDGEIQDIYNADLTGKCLSGPIIAMQPHDLAIPINEDAIFSLKVLGAKPLRYQWRFNGTNLTSKTSSTLALERVQSNVVGNYSVVITNSLGRATSSAASLTLLPPSTCVYAPTGIVAWWPANGFTNDVIGTNNASFALRFGASTATYATGKVDRCFSFTNGAASAGSSPALNIGSNADFSIEAWCKIVQPLNALASSSTAIPLVQKFGPQVIILPPPTRTIGYALLLYNGRLACQLTTPPFSDSDLETFTSFAPDIRDGLFHHVAFTFHRIATNGGNLYVDGQNVLTFDTTQFGRTSLSNSVPLEIGDDSSGFPGFPDPSSPQERLDELSIYNRALSPAEILSIYQAGTAGKCIPPPTMSVPPTNQIVQAGTTATLRVVASGFPPLLYQWTKNGTIVSNATNSTLVFSNVTVADAGQFSVLVSNVGGVHISPFATLTVNRPPIANNFYAATIQNSPITIPIEKLLFSAADPDADPLALLSFATPTPNGGSLVRASSELTYTPPTGFIGLDSCLYTVTDGRGGSASAFINIQIRSANDPSGNLLPLTPITGGFRVSFAGIPNRTYTLQRSEFVSGPWSNVSTITIGSLGIAIYDDTNSPPPTAFYRTVYP